MNITFKSFLCSQGDCTIISLFKNSLETKNEEINKVVKHLEDTEKFLGDKGEIYSFTRTLGDNKIQDIVLVGLGEENKVTKEDIRKAMGKAYKKALDLKCKKVFVRIIESNQIDEYAVVRSMSEGLGLASYSFNKYKKDNKETENEISLGACDLDEIKDKELNYIVDEANILVNSTCLARNLVNEPANILYPETLAYRACDAGRENGFEVEVLDKKQIENLKMESFLSVAKGSDNEPKLIVMRYFGDKDNKDNILGLVGKGLTYDAGGYSIKTSDGMVTMKSDMGGAASVIGAMSAIAKKGLKINVIGVVAACENLISGHAYKPGDIIGSMAGKTIEVLNTDAEGRLTLIDAVTYAIEKEKVSEVIDIATLTGAALVALGTTTTAVVSNNDNFYNELLKASEFTGEKVWRLPDFDEYKELFKSDIADLKNLGGRNGGTITAGLFIGEFVKDKPWLHLDIAGTAWIDKNNEYCTKGGTGVAVRTFYQLVKNRNTTV